MNPILSNGKPFSFTQLPYYQFWIGKITGNYKILLAKCETCPIPISGTKPAIAWANYYTQTIYLSPLLESLKYGEYVIKYVLLHEAGHLFNPRRKEKGMGSLAISEYLAQKWAINTLNKHNGLFREKEILIKSTTCWRKPQYDKRYRIAYRMLKKTGVLCQ